MDHSVTVDSSIVTSMEFGDSWLNQWNNYLMDPCNPINNYTAPLSAAEMSDPVNLEDSLAFNVMEVQNTILPSELPACNLEEFLNNTNMHPTTGTDVCTTINNCSAFENLLDPGDKFTDILESFVCNESSFPLSVLESETFHNIEDFLNEDVDVEKEKNYASNSSTIIDNAECTAAEKSENIPGTSKTVSMQKSSHEKYLEMRKKNNIASRRSRQIRKKRNKDMATEIVELEKTNLLLKHKVGKLEKKAEILRNYIMGIVKKSH